MKGLGTVQHRNHVANSQCCQWFRQIIICIRAGHTIGLTRKTNIFLTLRSVSISVNSSQCLIGEHSGLSKGVERKLIGIIKTPLLVRTTEGYERVVGKPSGSGHAFYSIVCSPCQRCPAVSPTSISLISVQYSLFCWSPIFIVSLVQHVGQYGQYRTIGLFPKLDEVLT